MPQDPLLELLQLGPWFQAELATSLTARRLVGVQRFGLPPARYRASISAASSRSRSGCAATSCSSSPTSVARCRPAQVGLDPVFQRAEPELLQPPGL